MKVLVSGGGTGGHIYPAISLVKEIQEREPDAEFLYVGTSRGLESKLVPQADIPFKAITIQGFRRSLSLENFKTVYLFLKSLTDSKKIIRDFNPDVVIGTGGYVCAPVVYAASKMGIPTIVHEQNSVPGVTNKFLSKYVNKVAICFQAAGEYFPKEKIVLTGNPRGQEVVQVKEKADLSTYGLSNEKETVLIFGGSQGALALIKAIEEVLPELNQRDYQVLFGTGSRYYDSVVEKLGSFDYKPKSLVVCPYIENMAEVLNAVDIVVSRAGATTLAELTALGVPSVLVPSPNVTNDHQTKNAKTLVDIGAAQLLTDDTLTGSLLLATLDTLMGDKDRRAQMAEAAKSAGIPDATDRLYELVIAVLGKSEK